MRSRGAGRALLLGLALALPALPAASGTPDFSPQITAAHQLAQTIRPVWFDALIAALDPDFRRRAPAGSTLTVMAAQLLVDEAEPGLSQPRARARTMQTTLALARAAAPEDILCIVLQHGAFGLGLHGHDTAARRYFRKGADELSLAELATLAALLTAPDELTADPGRLLQQRNAVLEGMQAMGAIDSATLERSRSQPLGL